MKAFLLLVLSAVIYFVVGLIAWNIVFSFLEVGKMTIVELSDKRLLTYSAVSGIISYLIYLSIDSQTFSSEKDYDSFQWVIIVVAIVNYLIAIAVNHWEGIWNTVAIIFTIVYNVINVGLIWLFCIIKSDDKK